MERTISILTETCTKCGRCVKICPSAIFVQSSPTAAVAVENIETCIACGHCAAICPTASVAHSNFPPIKVHAFDRADLPTPEQMMLLIKSRRSNRAFSTKAVPLVLLDMIVEAAYRAPTASNQQNVSFTLITNPDKIKSIIDFTIGVFSSVVKKLTNPFVKAVVKPFAPSMYGYVPLFNRVIEKREQGLDPVLRGATAVLLIHTPADSRFGATNANLAYQNASLMAESLGVAQFYTGFVCSAINQSDKLNKELGITGKIYAGMALGMSSLNYSSYVDRQPIKLTKLA